MKKYFLIFIFWTKNLFFSYFFQLSKLRFISKKKLVESFFILIFLFIILGFILIGVNFGLIKIFKLLKLL